MFRMVQGLTSLSTTSGKTGVKEPFWMFVSSIHMSPPTNNQASSPAIANRRLQRSVRMSRESGRSSIPHSPRWLCQLPEVWQIKPLLFTNGLPPAQLQNGTSQTPPLRPGYNVASHSHCSAIQCIRGTCSSCGHTIKAPLVDRAINELTTSELCLIHLAYSELLAICLLFLLLLTQVYFSFFGCHENKQPTHSLLNVAHPHARTHSHCNN